MKNIIKGIKNLIYWFPVIWEDRQWDHLFLLFIINHKLKRMYAFFDSDEQYTAEPDISKIKKSIKNCIEYIEIYDSHRESTHPIYDTDCDIQEAVKLEDKSIADLFATMKDNVRTWWD